MGGLRQPEQRRKREGQADDAGNESFFKEIFPPGHEGEVSIAGKRDLSGLSVKRSDGAGVQQFFI